MEGPFLEPAGVHYDAWEQEIFICDKGGHRIAIADDRGVPTFSFGSREVLLGPKRVAVDRRGRMLVVDTGYDGVRIFDYDGRALGDLDLSAVPPGAKPMRPVAILLREDGGLWLLDAANRRVVRTHLEGGAARVFGAPAGRTDLLTSPVALDALSDGTLVVADATGLSVQLYEPSGKFLHGWGEHEVGMANFSLPAGVAVDGEDRIFVVDTLRHDVKVFRPDGTFVTNFGGYGVQPGQLFYPVDVASDRQGRLFVAERGSRRVQVFRIGGPHEDARAPAPR